MPASTNETKQLIELYYQDAEPTAFMSGMFTARPGNMHASEKIEIDIVRSEEDVSIVVQDLSTGYRMNSENLYTTKEFTPPIHKEAIALNAFDLLKRMPGNNPFERPDFRATVLAKAFGAMRKIENKIRRAIELQASQVLQTGIVTLTNEAGAALYSLDYKPKSAHFPTAGVSWATATLEQKLGNIQTLCNTIRSDGLRKPDQIVMGETAFENLISTTGFKDRFDNQRADRGTITPARSVGEGGIYQGVIIVGNYTLDVFTYDGRYTDPQTGNSTPFMDPGKVIIKSSAGRMDATFGAIPNFASLFGVSSRLIPELPARMSSAANGMDLFTNVWLSADGEQLLAGAGARPLMVPTGIDTYGCLDTQL